MNEIIREVVVYMTFGQLVIQVWGGSLYIETDILSLNTYHTSGYNVIEIR